MTSVEMSIVIRIVYTTILVSLLFIGHASLSGSDSGRPRRRLAQDMLVL